MRRAVCFANALPFARRTGIVWPHALPLARSCERRTTRSRSEHFSHVGLVSSHRTFLCLHVKQPSREREYFFLRLRPSVELVGRVLPLTDGCRSCDELEAVVALVVVGWERCMLDVLDPACQLYLTTEE